MSSDARILVDYRTADDAGVYEWQPNAALVHGVEPVAIVDVYSPSLP